LLRQRVNASNNCASRLCSKLCPPPPKHPSKPKKIKHRRTPNRQKKTAEEERTGGGLQGPGGQIAPNIQISPGSSSPEEFFRWAEQLDGVPARLQSLEHWQQIEGQMIVPSVTQGVRALDGGLGGEVAERWRTWRDRYLPELRLLLVELRRQAAQKSQALSRAVAAAVDPLLPTERSGETGEGRS